MPNLRSEDPKINRFLPGMVAWFITHHNAAAGKTGTALYAAIDRAFPDLTFATFIEAAYLVERHHSSASKLNEYRDRWLRAVIDQAYTEHAPPQGHA